MATKTFKFLSYDTTRCMGANCQSKITCARFTQIEKDKGDKRAIRLSYIASGVDKETDECSIRIEE